MLYKGCINLNISNIVKSYSNLTVFYLNIFQNGIYSCESKAEFSHHYYSLQCHVILQKSFYYADFVLKKHSLFLLSKLKTAVLI